MFVYMAVFWQALFACAHFPNALINLKLSWSFHEHDWNCYHRICRTIGLALPCLNLSKELLWRTRLQVKLAEVLGGAEGDHNHTVPEDVLPCGHLESDLCAGDETVLLDHWVNRLHPAVPEVYPGEGETKVGTSGERDTTQFVWCLSTFPSHLCLSV